MDDLRINWFTSNVYLVCFGWISL